MKKILIGFTVALGLLISQGVYAGSGFTSSPWYLVKASATSTPFWYSCDYVRTIFYNGNVSMVQPFYGGAWWTCPLTINPTDLPLAR